MHVAQLKKVIKTLDRAKNSLYSQYGNELTPNFDTSCHPKEHWLGWLDTFKNEGYCKRKHFGNVRAKSVYNALQCPSMLIWLAEASNVPNTVIQESLTGIEPNSHLATMCGRIRRKLTWELIEKHLVEFNNNQISQPKLSLEKSFTLPKRITKKWAKEFLESQTWKTSVSPYTRHQYLFKERLIRENAMDKKTLKILEQVAEWIHEKGSYYTWRNRVFIYLFIGEYKYWAMWYADGSMASVNRWRITGKEVASTLTEVNSYTSST